MSSAPLMLDRLWVCLLRERRPMDLDGCAALVTGGSGDIGAAIARALAAAGADVVVTYLSERDRADSVAAEVAGHGRRSLVIRLDQADDQMPQHAVTTAVDHFGRLDILVNNAAWNIGIPFGDLDALTPEIWDRLYETNVRGPFLLARAAAPVMRAQRRGRIVNIASVGGLLPGGSSIGYATSKAALIHLTRCLAVALAPHVLVNSVAPGLVEATRMFRRIPPEMVEAARRSTLLDRGVRASDVADQTVAFCRTDSTTGQVLAVDGGIFSR
jgi:3-oxoacyl-[acyl-carrier protein] reductase